MGHLGSQLHPQQRKLLMELMGLASLPLLQVFLNLIPVKEEDNNESGYCLISGFEREKKGYH